MNALPRLRSQFAAVVRRVQPVALPLALSLSFNPPATAQIDVLETVVDAVTATDGSAIAAFGYNPVDDTMFVSGFGAGGALRKVTDVSGSPASTVYVSEAQLQLYYRDGDPDRGVSTPLQSAILLNPAPLGSGDATIPAYGMAVFADNGFTRLPASTTTDPAVTKRFYAYNLQPVNTPPGPGEFGDGRDVFTTLATLADMQTAIGATATSSNQGRQFAWSGDGQRIYFADSSTAFGGLWTLDPLSGAVARLAAEDDFNTELAVIAHGDAEDIYVRGGGSTGNVGGIDKFAYEGGVLGPRTPVVTVEQLREFLDANEDMTPTVFSMTSRGGTLYFNNTDGSPERRGIFRLDEEGRLAKVVSYAERDLAFTGALNAAPNPNGNTLRMQPRTVEHPTAGPITQILYAESSPINLVAGAYDFVTGDFDRNGTREDADLQLFSAALAPRGTEIANEGHYKFDLNGNSVVDWKDVKILQQFAAFPTGDVNFDSVLDLIDLDTLGVNYYTSENPAGKTWRDGDLASVDPLYPADAADANRVDAVDVGLFADTWLNVLEQAITQQELTSRGYEGQFLADVLAAFGFGAGVAGDFNGDQVVDGADLLVWQRGYGSAADPPGSGADGSGDGLVDDADLIVWEQAFGPAPPAQLQATAVPEPVGAWLALAGLAAYMGRRQR